ncbi:MAG: cyclic nucleotide-binding domain-containing protein [Alphaproteobacteria bacterium]|nr:cyclic nucleotide-binding domain-containing protein [Alphaproteobacteria bacterium]
MLQKNHMAHFVSALSFFNGLAEEEVAELIRDAAAKTYPRGTGLFHQGDAADRLFIVVSGWVKLFRTTENGDESIIALFSRGDVFGEAAIFGGVDYPFSAVAAEESAVLEIPAETLRRKAKQSPQMMERIMRSMSQEMRRAQMENEHMVIMTAPQRVGCLLLQLSSGMRGDGGCFTFPYDKSLAAQRLGMKPETFSRALAQLKSSGVASKGAEVGIDNYCRLAAFCCISCSAGLADCKGAARKNAAIGWMEEQKTG